MKIEKISKTYFPSSQIGERIVFAGTKRPASYYASPIISFQPIVKKENIGNKLDIMA